MKYDVAIVGAGIVGLAHAWMASRRGLRTVLFERSAAARGASVRNFGMVWPIGQPAGELSSIARRSRELWLELKAANVLPVEECGSLHLAHHADEMAILEEFRHQKTHPVELLSPAETIARSRLVNADGLRGSMYSGTELRVDPRTASGRIAEWLQKEQGVDCFFSTSISAIEGKTLKSPDSRSWEADRVILCSNDDLQTLFPTVLQSLGLILCKLQMLKAGSSLSSGPPEPHIASGLTLRHYTSFRNCPTIERLKTRIAEATPELDEFGIHVMASAFPGGDIILGDSHEYGEAITPFDQPAIDALIIRELQKVIRLDSWKIVERWHGIYAKHAELPVAKCEVEPGVHCCVGTGGAGMTMAFGLADQMWRQWNRET